MLFSIIFCEDPSTWGRLSFICWFIFINISFFLCVAVTPKVILSKISCCCYTVSRKILDVKSYVAATPRTTLLQHHEQQRKKNCVAATPFPENEFLCFSELKTEYFSASKTKYYFDQFLILRQSRVLFYALFLCFWIIRKQSITLCSYFCCFGIYQKILNSGNKGFFHCILFGITRNSRHGIRACPGSLKTSKKFHSAGL